MNQPNSSLHDSYDFSAVCNASHPGRKDSLQFFRMVADEIIRALHPNRVLDVGCATGFLVQAFWDRGVHCEGIDVSENDLSQARNDIRSYCSLHSILEPIDGRFDLITCIGVLEYIPPELMRIAVGNLCAASDLVLLSSPSGDPSEAVRRNAGPTISWLEIFSEFDFYPDIRFDAGFLSPNGVLLRKGRPSQGDLQQVFSDLMRYKRALDSAAAGYKQTAELLQHEKQEKNRLVAALSASESDLALARADLGRVSALERELLIAAEIRRGIAIRLEKREREIRELREQLVAWRAESERNQASLVGQLDQLRTMLTAKEHEVLRVQATLDGVLASRAWRLAEKCRRPLLKIRHDWPRLHRILRFIARKTVSASWYVRYPLASSTALECQTPSPEGGEGAVPSAELVRQAPADEPKSAMETSHPRHDCENILESSVDGAAPIHSGSQPRQHTEEEMIVSWFDCTEEQFRYIREQNTSLRGFRDVKRLLWFLPYFENPFYGGVFTILRFAEYWHRTKGVENVFAICANTDRNAMLARLRAIYPQLRDSNIFVVADQRQASELPSVDASICTLWTTAYFAAHHRKPARRFYLIQDFEPAFYRAGSASAVVESTYYMGMYGIANTVSLKKTYESEYGGKAVYFKPCVDTSLFYPPPSQNPRAHDPFKVFIYGRPGQTRNAFELIVAAMRLVKDALGDYVHIYSAGSDWNPSDYSLQGIVENLGLLAYEDTARLYRESDVGVVMMLTRHPSYIPFELMASGCLVVTNVNPFTSWLLRDGVNCLLTRMTPSSIAENVKRGILDESLRGKIVENSLSLIRSDYSDWQGQMDQIYEYLCDPEGYLLTRNDDNFTYMQEALPVRAQAATS